MSLPTVVAEILLKSMEIFSEERKRHFESEYAKLEKNVLDCKNAHSPEYNDAKLALAIEERDTFLRAYQKEFNVEMDALIKKVISNA